MPRHRSHARKSKRKSSWQRFDLERTNQTSGDVNFWRNTLVSLVIPPNSTPRHALEHIASKLQPPLPIEVIHSDLNKIRFPRGKTIFGLALDEIDTIAANYEGMVWWVSKRGLNVDLVSPLQPRLSDFDELAGRLCAEGSNGRRISKKLLLSIATQLDDAGFSLKDTLQRAQRLRISQHNQQYSKATIKTFVAACSHPRFSYQIRRRLYVARDRYMKARGISAPTLS
jgi:hypothetical protein